MDTTPQLSAADAYKCMFEFVDAYWRRGGKSEESIARMLSSMQFSDDLGHVETIDSAMWADWMDAVNKVIK